MLALMPNQKTPVSTFGAGLITARQARGVTQVQLAEALGTTQRMISYYEAEGGNPPLDTVIAIAKILHTTTDQLLGFAKLDDPTVRSVDDRRYWRRFQQLMGLPEKDQRAVFRTLDTMTKASIADKAKR